MNRHPDGGGKSIPPEYGHSGKIAGAVQPARSMRGAMGRFRSTLATRLQHGEHLILYGPRGSGKSTLLAELHAHLTDCGTPCARSSTTARLEDMTSAFVRAYPEVATAYVTRRRARARLRLAAEQRAGVLLLDHVTSVGTAMLGSIHRLRGGLAGILMAVDVDGERERLALRERRLGMPLLSMPPLSARRLRALFRMHCANLDLPAATPLQERQIVRAARGRPGWVVQCARLIAQDRYWRDQTLYASVLCLDTEIALQLGPHSLPPLSQPR